jgi:hypothetical protein
MVIQRRITATSLRTLAHPDGGLRRLARLLGRYLAAVFLLLVIALLVAPGDPPRDTGDRPPAWDYQREVVAIEGRGPLNVAGRALMRATAWATRSTIERQRDLHGRSLLATLVGEPAAAAVGPWRDHWRRPLEGCTALTILGLVGYGLLRNPTDRTWLVAVLMLVSLTIAITRPATTVRVAAAPGQAVAELAVRGFATVDPARRPVPLPSPAAALRDLTAEYWDGFVAHPLSRMQTGGAVLATAPPATKPGLLGYLRQHVAVVNDWAAGRHGWERTFIAGTALVYALPFALLLASLAMLATGAQALALLLTLGALVALPLAVDPRRRAAIVRFWLAPLGGALVVLFAAAFTGLVITRLAVALHGADERLGLLLAGSALPVAAALLLARRLRRFHWPRLGFAGGGAK